MATKYGVFKEIGYKPQGEGAGEGTQKFVNERPLNFKVSVSKTGKNNDAAFSKFVSLNEGDQYMDPKRRALLAEAEKNKAFVTDKPFKMVSPMKRSVGPGDYYGTLGAKLPHEPEFTVEPKKKGEIPEKPKGIYTNPGKKGTFGFNKFTLSERQGYKGVATEYEYQHDPDEMQKQKRMDTLNAHHKACVTDKPFRPANPPKKGTYGMINTTISKGKGVAGEWEYVMAKPPSAPEGSEGAEKPKKEELVPFRPSNAHVAKRTNHIAYLHDPLEPKLQKEHDRKLDESKRLSVTGPWRPNMSYKSDMVRSVVKMNIPR